MTLSPVQERRHADKKPRGGLHVRGATPRLVSHSVLRFAGATTVLLLRVASRVETRVTRFRRSLDGCGWAFEGLDLRMRDLVACKPCEATGRSLAGSCEERGG